MQPKQIQFRENIKMANDVKKVLVIGGGFSGMVAAIAMRRKGIDVDLV